MDERTIYDRKPQDGFVNEDTELTNDKKMADGKPVPPSVKSGKNDTLKKAALGVCGGILLGGAAIGLTSMTKGDNSSDIAPEDESKPDWLKGDVNVAQGVNDSMSFDEAFAAARAEVGAGGAFEWRGGVYGTYTAAEWNNMSAAERAQWGENFSWGNLHPDEGSLAANHHSNTVVVEEHHHYHNNTTAQTTAQVTSPHKPVGPVVDDTRVEPEVKVLAVVDSEHAPLGYNTALLSVDGEDVFLFDVDNDMTFDVMVHDRNNDGNFSEDEFISINDDKLTVANLGGFHVSSDAHTGAEPTMTAQNTGEEGIDYTRDYEQSEITEESDSTNLNPNGDVDYATEEIAQAEISYAEPSVAEVHGAEPNIAAEVAYHPVEAEVSVTGTEGVVEDGYKIAYNGVEEGELTNAKYTDTYDTVGEESGLADDATNPQEAFNTPDCMEQISDNTLDIQDGMDDLNVIDPPIV